MKLPPPLQQQVIETNASSGNEVKQKMFDLSTDKTTEFIVNLKSKMTNNNSLSKSSQNTGSTTKDTSLWEIEALLNFDFDKATNPLESSSDLLNFEININANNTVDFTEVNSAYVFFTNQINQHLLANLSEKVKLVDVTATESNNKLYVNAHVMYTTDNSNQKVSTSPCDAITNSGHWSGGPRGWSWVCTSIPIAQRGPNMCNTVLNCTSYNCSNGEPPYYTNLVTIQRGLPWNTNQYYTALQAGPVCNSAYLNATKLNQNISYAQTDAVTYKPTSPAGLSVVNYAFKSSLVEQYSGAVTYVDIWLLDIKYGTVNCPPTGGGGGGN